MRSPQTPGPVTSRSPQVTSHGLAVTTHKAGLAPGQKAQTGPTACTEQDPMDPTVLRLRAGPEHARNRALRSDNAREGSVGCRGAGRAAVSGQVKIHEEPGAARGKGGTGSQERGKGNGGGGGAKGQEGRGGERRRGERRGKRGEESGERRGDRREGSPKVVKRREVHSRARSRSTVLYPMK